MSRGEERMTLWLQTALSYRLRKHVEARLREPLLDRGIKILYLRAEEPTAKDDRIFVKWGCEYRLHEYADGIYYEGQEEFTLADVFGIAMGIHYGKPPI